MGTALTAEFIIHDGSAVRYSNESHLNAAARLAPVLRQIERTLFLTTPLDRNNNLKRTCYRIALSGIKYYLISGIHYDTKLRQGESHCQAMIVLARKRTGVLCALLKRPGTYLNFPQDL